MDLSNWLRVFMYKGQERPDIVEAFNHPLLEKKW
jgi:hypothetical protein